MKTVILAAGYATRLYPLTKDFPKPLLKVGENAILEWLLSGLEPIEAIEEHVLVSNHKFYPVFADWARRQTATKKPLKIIDDGTECNENRLGAVLDIRLAAEQEGPADFLVLAGDNLLDFSLAGFVEFFQEKSAPCVMCYQEKDLKKRQKTGIIQVDRQDRILTMQEKPQKPLSDLAVPPFYCYRAEDLACIPQAVAEGCGLDAPGSFVSWLCGKRPVYAYRMPGKRQDIGDPESYYAACRAMEQITDGIKTEAT